MRRYLLIGFLLLGGTALADDFPVPGVGIGRQIVAYATNVLTLTNKTFDTALNTFKANGKTITSLVQILGYSFGGTASQATTYFLGPAGANVTENVIETICPISGTFRNLTLLTGTIGGSAQTVTATMRVNGSGTSLTCQISTGSTTCSDNTHTATCTAGQPYSIQVALSATTGTVSFVAAALEFDNP